MIRPDVVQCNPMQSNPTQHTLPSATVGQYQLGDNINWGTIEIVLSNDLLKKGLFEIERSDPKQSDATQRDLMQSNPTQHTLPSATG
eukprot:2442340-Ditylum_brightwellii.AAC.1